MKFNVKLFSIGVGSLFVFACIVMILWFLLNLPIVEPPPRCFVQSMTKGPRGFMGNKGSTSFTWSPNGDYLVFKPDTNGGLFVAQIGDPDKNYTNLVNTAENAFDLSPDGQQIAFTKRQNGQLNIWITTLNGDKETQLTHSSISSNFYPIWSPNGEQLAFLGKGGSDQTRLQVMTIDSGHQIELVEQKAWDYMWSPDGQMMVFVSDADGDSDIYVKNISDNKLTQLTDSPQCDESPVWSPDGKRIAFISTRDQNMEIYLMNVDGSQLQNLTKSDADEKQISWSPDGKKIAFMASDVISLGNYSNEIYIMNTDGSERTRLTNTQNVDESFPQWSPDGQKIAFISHQEKKWYINLIDVDGGNYRRLITLPTVPIP